MKTFRIYYTNGNQRLLEANNWKELLAYLIETEDDDAIEDIELVEDNLPV